MFLWLEEALVQTLECLGLVRRGRPAQEADEDEEAFRYVPHT